MHEADKFDMVTIMANNKSLVVLLDYYYNYYFYYYVHVSHY